MKKPLEEFAIGNHHFQRQTCRNLCRAAGRMLGVWSQGQRRGGTCRKEQLRLS